MLSRCLLLALSVASSVLGSNSWISPGAVWYDTDGNKIDAHGGGLYKHGSTFYWIGYSISNDITPYMYSSTDLLNWENLGARSTVENLWRPKIAKPNGKYWIFGQQDRYATSLSASNLVGSYTEQAKVLLPPNDYSYSDTGMFHDESSDTWYLLTSADHNTIQVNQINSDGSVGDRVSKLNDGKLEAPGMFKAGEVYFLIVSGKTGYRANPNKVYTSTSINGPWSGGSDIAPEDENTYGSQNTFEFTIAGSSKTTYIYMGDAWDDDGTASSNYVWLPMDVDTSEKTVTLQYHSSWKVDVKTGEVSYPSSSKRYEAADARLTGRASLADCDNCVTKRSVQNIDAGSEVTFRNITGTGQRQWLAFHYTVNDPKAGQAHIFVNNDTVATNMSDFNSRAGYYKVVPIQLIMNEGNDNTITFGANGSQDFKVSLEGIEFYKEE